MDKKDSAMITKKPMDMLIAIHLPIYLLTSLLIQLFHKDSWIFVRAVLS